MPEIPPFDPSEFERRVERARASMARHRLDGLVVTSQANVEYLSGFVTQFAWVTPSRPWYFVLPREGEPSAIIPEIGLTNWLETSWCRTVSTWPSPRPDDEGIGLLRATLERITVTSGRIGFEMGAESRLGMPVADFLRLRDLVPALEFVDGTPVTLALRMVKSPAEIARVRRACAIAGRSFANLPRLVSVGDSERAICRRFAADLLTNGADKVPYTSIGSGPGGYDSIIMGPTERRMADGDILMIDTGVCYDGYFCDFDRNFAFGTPSDAAARIHELLWLATEAGIAAARPGNTAADVFAAQARVIEGAGLPLANVGRFGHGLGKLITEFPSIAPTDTTLLVPGMVLTIEPSAMFGRFVMAHEENVAVTEAEPELLTERAPREMARVG